MREIEFRAWDKRNKRYCKNPIAVSNDGVLEMIEDVWVDTQFQAEQYTGLKDKNGNKIFEGDIVKLQEGHKSYYIVKWHEKYCFWHFQFIIKPKEYYRFKDIEKNFGRGNGISKIEIIGNIHDNPELLEER